MKKKILITLIFVILSVSFSFGQAKPFKFGLKVAANIGWISPDSEDYEANGSVPGFTWGFISDFVITENYFVGTGFNMNYLNGKLKYPYQECLDGDTIGTLKRKYNLSYIEIPLTLKMKTNKFDEFAFFGRIGFSLGFNIKSKAQDDFVYKIDSQYENETSKSNISDEVTFLKGAVVLGAGFEYSIDNTTSIVVGVTYNNGLSNILKGENTVNKSIDQKATVNSVEFTVGVIF